MMRRKDCFNMADLSVPCQQYWIRNFFILAYWGVIGNICEPSGISSRAHGFPGSNTQTHPQAVDLGRPPVLVVPRILDELEIRADLEIPAELNAVIDFHD